MEYNFSAVCAAYYGAYGVHFLFQARRFDALGIFLGFKGIYFSADFVPPAKIVPPVPAEKSALAKQPIIAENLLDKPTAKKPLRAKRSRALSNPRRAAGAKSLHS